MNDDESLHKHIQLDGRETTEPTDDPFARIAREQAEKNRGEGGDGNGGGGDSPVKRARPSHVKIFYRDVLMVLTEPTRFYNERFPLVTFAYSLTFAIIVAWIASCLEWLTRLVRHETLFDNLTKMRQSLQSLPLWKNVPDNFWAQTAPQASAMSMPPWTIEIFGIILSPFQTLVKVVTYGVVIFVGSYLLVPKTSESGRDAVELKTVIKIVAFSSAPVLIGAILGFLPIGLSGFIAGIYSFVLLAIGLSTRFKVSGLRSVGIIILPGLVGAFLMSCVLGVVIALFYGLFTSMFGGMN